MKQEMEQEMSSCAPGQQRSFWARTVIGWHVAFYFILGLVGLIGGLDDAITTHERLALWGLLALLGTWYAALGRRVLGMEDNRLGVIYAVVVIALVTALTLITDASFMLLFILFPQLFSMVTLPVAIPLVAALSLVVGLASVAGNGWTAEAVASGSVIALINTAFAAVFGLWIRGILTESQRRAELVEELQRTRAKLAEAHHEAGALAERERLAREIHDTLAQGFTSILMLAQAADAAVGRDPAAARERIGMIEDSARENLAEARSLVTALGPVDLASASLREALGRLVQRFGAELAIDVAVKVSGPVRPLPANDEVVLLRATQEALANVRKHAKASRVDVELGYAAESVRLQVTDNGRGFTPADAEGFGLPGMRARVEQVGGRMEVRSGPGEGTAVSIVISGVAESDQLSRADGSPAARARPDARLR